MPRSRRTFTIRSCAPFVQEELESRRFFTVTIEQGYTGYYDIESDSDGDTIAVSVNQGDHTLTVGDATYPDVAYIEVHGNGGDDTIDVSSVDGSGDISAVVDGGKGNDSLSLNFDGGIWGGAGDDVIHLGDSFYGQAIGGAGNDAIFISGGCVSAQIEGNGGDDLIDATASGVGLVLHGGDGRDTILGSEYDDQIYGDDGNDVLSGNGGNDTFYVRDGNKDTIDGGDGNDIGRIDDDGEGGVNNVEQIIFA